jgi:hypothetical protein
MNPITQHHVASAQAPGPGRQVALPAGPPRRRLKGRAHTASARAGIIGAAAAAVLFAGALTASAAPSQSARGAAGSPADSMLRATFTDSDVSVTPGLGMVELILTGTGTARGFGAATDVVGVVEDRAASPCGPGGASDSAQARIVMHGGVLELHEAARLCVTAAGPQVNGTYRVAGRASTGIFAGARGTGHVTVDVATGQDTLSGTLILREPPDRRS